MKHFLTTFCAFVLTTIAYAQQPAKALVKVQYNFIHIQDTAHPEKPFTENMLLVVDKNASMYVSYDRINAAVNDRLERQELLKKGLTDQDVNELNRAKGPYKQHLLTQYYYFFSDNKFFSKETICVNGCMVEDVIEKPDWKISKETMDFSGIRAQKATTKFKGRNYTAWFAPELPFASGPWKLNGLPGLIIEAYDDKKEVQFKFAGVENIKPGDLATEAAHQLSPQNLIASAGMAPGTDLSAVALPPARETRAGGYQKMTKVEYDKLKVAYDKDPRAFTEAQLAGMGVPSDVRAAMLSGGRGGGSSSSKGGGPAQMQAATRQPEPVKNAINNPIELSE